MVACNYKLSNSSSIQFGYLHQFDFQINDETGRDLWLLDTILICKKRITTSQIAPESASRNSQIGRFVVRESNV